MTKKRKRGMQSGEGVFYEDLIVKQKIKHPLGRTLTDTDNIWFTLLTCNTNQIHFNQDYTKKNYSRKPFGGRLAVNAYLILSLVAGLSIEQTSRNGIMISQENMKILSPVFSGDTLYAETTILSKRISKTHKGMGIVQVRTKGYNQRGIDVVVFERTFMTRMRGSTWR